ncbi:MAG: FAD-dependent monooxygenase [Devosia sp.]
MMVKSNRRVLISGASVAGPALAFWLGRAGHDVTVVERASKLRDGGYAVDFRGPTHLEVLRRMGILPDLEAMQTHGGAMRFIDQRERTRLFLPAEFAGGDVEVRRSDLSRVLHDHSRPAATYVFGDSIRSLTQDADGVDVTFEQSTPKRFDLVFGADGIHSSTRGLTFAGQNFERDSGYYIASWDIPGAAAPVGESLICNVLGRSIGVSPAGRDGTPPGVTAFFASPPLNVDRRDVTAQKAILKRTFGSMRWRVPELLTRLDDTDELFFNTISRAIVPNWSVGRVALVGDAAGGTSIGGMGTGTAIVAAYILAGELASTPDDYSGAFARYQARVEPYATECAKNGESAGRFHAPKTVWGMAFRDSMLAIPAIKAWMIRIAGNTAVLELPTYSPLQADKERRPKGP